MTATVEERAGIGPDDQLSLAVERLRAGDYAGALTYLDAALEVAPEDSTALAYAGLARLHLKEVQVAQELLDRAVAAGPADFIAWAKRGELRFKLACFPQAAEDLRHALTLKAPSVASRRLVAKMLETAEQRARLSYTRTLTLPTVPAALRRGAAQVGTTWSTAVAALFRRATAQSHRPAPDVVTA